MLPDIYGTCGLRQSWAAVAPRGKKKKAASAALQALSDLKPTGDVSDTPVDFAKLAAAGKDGAAATDGAPAKDPPGTGTLYIVDVYGRKAGQAMQVELTGTQMKRKKKGGFAREVRGATSTKRFCPVLAISHVFFSIGATEPPPPHTHTRVACSFLWTWA